MNIVWLIMNMMMLLASIVFTLWYAKTLSKVFRLKEQYKKLNDIAALTILLMCIILI